MSCNLIYGENRKLENVVADNGNTSLLYKEALKEFGESQALEIYLASKSDDFQDNVLLSNSELDVNNEPKLKTVLNYLSFKNESKEPLTIQQKLDIKNISLGLDNFSIKGLIKAFYVNGIFNVSPKNLKKSGLYSDYEIANLVQDVTLQEKVKQSLEALKNTEYVELEEQSFDNLEKTNEINSFGKQVVINPYIIQKEIVDKLAANTEEEFERNLTDLEYPNFQKKLNKPIKKSLIQKVIDQLKKNTLANNVFVYSNAQIEQKLREIGFDSAAAKQVVAWHGSPYSFDKFTTNAMGTGEGAQAFGWGLYFTDLESIARKYSENEELITKHIERQYEFGLPDRFYNIPSSFKSNKEDLTNYIDGQIKGFEGVPYQQKEWQKLKNAVQSYKATTYKVSLHKGKTPSEYTWLEWDKPVNKEIKEKIKNKLNEIGINSKTLSKTQISWVNGERLEKEVPAYDFIDESKTGQEIYEGIAIKFNGELNSVQKEASLFLLESGIDGIKYPAESISNGATSDTARGFNYVVFDENAVTIDEQIQFQKIVDVSKQMAENQTYYSNTTNALTNLKDKNPKNVKGWISQLTDTQKNGGIKNVNQELEWIGLEDYLNEYVKENNPKAGNISSSVIEDYIKSNQIEIADVSKGYSPVNRDKALVIPKVVEEILAPKDYLETEYKKEEYGTTINFRDKQRDLILPRFSVIVASTGEVAAFINNKIEYFTSEKEAIDKTLKAIPEKSHYVIYDEFGKKLSGSYNAEWVAKDTYYYNDALRSYENDGIRENNPTKYSGYQLKGGENYREVLLTMPNRLTLPDGYEAKYVTITAGQDAGKSGYRVFDRSNRAVGTLHETEVAAVRTALTVLEVKGELPQEYKSSHWDEKNILAHVRMNEKTLPDGRRVLIVNEIQSDWNQQGKKEGFKTKLAINDEFGYKELPDGYTTVRRPSDGKILLYKGEEQLKAFDNRDDVITWLENKGVPLNPFVKTDQWVGLVTRRVMQMASQEGYDGIAFATGQQSADMYSLARQVDEIEVSFKGMFGLGDNVFYRAQSGIREGVVVEDDSDKTSVLVEDVETGKKVRNDRSTISVKAPYQRSAYISMKNGSDTTLFINNDGIITDSTNDTYIGKNAEDVLGKDLTKKILETTENTTLEGEGLEFGGEGMKTFYDKIVPKVVQKEAQRFDKNAKLETVDFNNTSKVPLIKDVTNVVLGSRSYQRYLRNYESNEVLSITELQMAIVDDMTELLVRNSFDSIEDAKIAKEKNDEDGIAVVRIYEQALQDHDNLNGKTLEDLKITTQPNTTSVTDKLNLGKQPYIAITDKMKSEFSQKGIPLFQKDVTLTSSGFVYKEDVYLNEDKMKLDTPVHEFGHLYLNWLKTNSNNTYQKGLELAQSKDAQEYVDYVERTQPHLTGEAKLNEILAQAIGDNGAKLADKTWIEDLWDEIKKLFGLSQYTNEQVQNMTLKQFTEAISVDIYKNQLFKEMQGYKKAEVFIDVDGDIVQSKNTNTSVILPLVARQIDNTEIISDINQIQQYDLEILNANIEDTVGILKEIEDGLIGEGVDVAGLSEKPIDKSLLDFIEVLEIFINSPTKDNTKIFSESYDNFFEKDITPKIENVKQEETNRDFIKLDTNLSEEIVYEQQGFIKVKEGLYVATDKQDLDTLYASLETYTDKYPKDISLKEYVQEQISKLDNFKNSDNAEAVYLYKMYFDIEEYKPIVKKQIVDYTKEIKAFKSTQKKEVIRILKNKEVYLQDITKPTVEPLQFLSVKQIATASSSEEMAKIKQEQDLIREEWEILEELKNCIWK